MAFVFCRIETVRLQYVCNRPYQSAGVQGSAVAAIYGVHIVFSEITRNPKHAIFYS